MIICNAYAPSRLGWGVKFPHSVREQLWNIPAKEGA